MTWACFDEILKLNGSAPVCFFSEGRQSKEEVGRKLAERKKGGKGEWLSGTVLKPCEHAVLAGR